eukprot:scaffold100_cov323-Pavlova_lutheri.AAC.13
MHVVLLLVHGEPLSWTAPRSDRDVALVQQQKETPPLWGLLRVSDLKGTVHAVWEERGTHVFSTMQWAVSIEGITHGPWLFRVPDGRKDVCIAWTLLLLSDGSPSLDASFTLPFVRGTPPTASRLCPRFPPVHGAFALSNPSVNPPLNPEETRRSIPHALNSRLISNPSPRPSRETT